MSKNIHFIGIAGTGMSALAVFLAKDGNKISGSDIEAFPPVTTYLDAAGIQYATSYDEKNIPEMVDYFVLGGTAKITEDNPELIAARASGKPIRYFPEVIGEYAKKKSMRVVVAGSQGKSSTTALLTWVLTSAGKDPGYFLPAFPFNLPETMRSGSGDIFVLEGDEYPVSTTNDASKFFSFAPTDILLTAANHDHVNRFPTLATYLEPFKKLIASLPANGLLVACSDGENVLELTQGCPAEIITYGTNGKGIWDARNINFGPKTTFDLYRENELICQLETTELGRYSVENITGVSAYVLSRDIITIEELQKAVASYSGLKRRLELKTQNSRVPVYEAFGSSYPKARAALEALRLHFPERRIVTIFEPHTFSWRNRDAIGWYDDVFKESSRILIYTPPTHGSANHAQLSLDEIVDRVGKTGASVTGIHSQDEALKILEEELKENDLVVLMTSGNLGGLIESVPNFVEKKFKV